MSARQFPAVLRFTDHEAGVLKFGNETAQAKPKAAPKPGPEAALRARIRDLEVILAATTRRAEIAEARAKAYKASVAKLAAPAPHPSAGEAMRRDAIRRGWRQ